jgi:23S rRNA pseudouridine1911/1915/1917 synthase
MTKPKILFEDTHLLVLSKPAGLLSQGEKTGDDNLVDWLRAYLGRPYVGLVHRLDRNTSGLMVAGKRTKSARRLTDALQQGDLKRKYLAWISGSLTKDARWEHWLLKNTSRNTTEAWRLDESHPKEAKRAALLVHPIRETKYQGHLFTLAEFELETGRSHQIRVQSTKEGHPLLGDSKYGGTRAVSFPRTALHSHWIGFPHPMSEEWMEFKEDLPADLVI